MREGLISLLLLLIYSNVNKCDFYLLFTLLIRCHIAGAKCFTAVDVQAVGSS